MEALFPRGVLPYLSGGLLIGAGVALIFIFTGVRAGASGVLTSTFSWFSRRPIFEALRAERAWRGMFTLGLLLGAALWTFGFSEPDRTTVEPLRLLLGGFLVGVGTRAARGCTSGHGICGLSSLSRDSLGHVCLFMGVAIVTAQAMGRLLP